MKEAQLGTGREREKLAFIDCLSVWSTGEYSFFFKNFSQTYWNVGVIIWILRMKSLRLGVVK